MVHVTDKYRYAYEKQRGKVTYQKSHRKPKDLRCGLCHLSHSAIMGPVVESKSFKGSNHP